MSAVDYPSVSLQTISTEDTDGSAFSEEEGWIIPLVIGSSEASTLLASYDEADSGSPSESESRQIARLILSALKKAVSG
jgi:hypothetical protein